MPTKINAAMTENVLRTDITNQALDADIVMRNSGVHKNVPIGTIVLFPSDSTPSGWLVCDGHTEAIALYPELYGLLGLEFGGDGTTTFAVMNLSASVPGAVLALAGGYIIRAANGGK
jgi:hypothetical protein